MARMRLSLASIMAAEKEMMLPAMTFAMIRGAVMEMRVLRGFAPTLSDARVPWVGEDII